MPLIDPWAIPLSLITLTVAFALFALKGLGLVGLSPRVPVAMTLVSGLTLLLVLIVRSQVAGFLALSNMYESVLAVTTAMTLGLAALSPKFRSAWVGALSVAGALGMLIFSLSLSQDIQPLQAALISYWRAIHVPIILSSYALFFLNLAGTLVSIGRGSLDQQADGLPDYLFYCVALGFPLLTVGVILGAVWANEAWGTYWNWDPKESMALATLLGYGIYLHLKLTLDASQKVLDRVAIGAFLLLLVTYFGVNVMGVGLHSYGSFQAG